jgi:hypothetical protein
MHEMFLSAVEGYKEEVLGRGKFEAHKLTNQTKFYTNDERFI